MRQGRQLFWKRDQGDTPPPTVHRLQPGGSPSKASPPNLKLGGTPPQVPPLWAWGQGRLWEQVLAWPLACAWYGAQQSLPPLGVGPPSRSSRMEEGG